MREDVAGILEAALRLPPEARAALAGSLIESLEEALDDGAEAAWEAEVERRVRDLDEGRVRAVPWAEARRRIAGTR